MAILRRLAALLAAATFALSAGTHAEKPKVWVLIAGFQLPDGSMHFGYRKQRGTSNPEFYPTEATCKKQQVEDMPVVEAAAADVGAVSYGLECIEVDEEEFLLKTGVVTA